MIRTVKGDIKEHKEKLLIGLRLAQRNVDERNESSAYVCVQKQN